MELHAPLDDGMAATADEQVGAFTCYDLLAWPAPLAYGEASHIPESARHGLGRQQLDPGAWLITTFERCHLARHVIRISPERQQATRCISAGGDGS